MADFDKEPCRTERLAFLLRQDIVGMPCTMPWLSTDERELYRQAVFNTYRRLRAPVDGTVGENIALVDKQVKLAIKGIAVMARGRADVLKAQIQHWAGYVALELHRFAEELEYLSK